MNQNFSDDRYHAYGGGGGYGGYGGDAQDDLSGGGFLAMPNPQSSAALLSGTRSTLGARPSQPTMSHAANIMSDTGSALNSRGSVHPFTGADPDSHGGGGGHRVREAAAEPGGAYFENNNQQPLLGGLPDGAPAREADPFGGGAGEKLGCVYQMRRCMGWTVSKERRTIHLTGLTRPRTFPSNKLNNQKYTIITFLPLLLYNEFKFFFNMFFLVIALSQFVPFLKVGLLVTYVAPLVSVLAVSMLKEAYDDFQRAQRDKALNLTKFEKITSRVPSGLSTISAKDIRVGQIIKIKPNQRLPADMLLLQTTEKSGAIFLRTDQLDGETDWKLRKALPQTQKLSRPQDLLAEEGYVVALPPSEEVYDFKAYFQSAEDAEREPLSLENTMWQNTVLASQGYVYGLVLYTGKETRSNMSSKKPRSKSGSLDYEINHLAKILFFVMLVLSLVIIVMDGFLGSWYFKYFRCVLLLCSIIPISMRLNLDFAKLYYSFKINTDAAIPDTVARTTTIPEELGRIQFLLSDKTGTLTKNDMIFKRLNLEYYSFSDENLDEVKILLKKGLKKTKDKFLSTRHHRVSSDVTSDEGGSMLDPDGFAHPPERVSTEGPKRDAGSIRSPTENMDCDELSNCKTAKSKLAKIRRRGRRREQHQIVMDLFLALILCHNVTPTYSPAEEAPPRSSDKLEDQFPTSGVEEGSDTSYKVKEFQASSPDEIALVKFAESLGMILEEREELFVKIRDTNGHAHEYQILENFPFSSETKRMGIVVRNKETGHIMFYLKGAEVVMEEKVRPDQRVSLTEACEQLAQDGLRTLVISQKQLTDQEYEAFSARYTRARASLNDREFQVEQAVGSIEDGMEFLAVTGVEDKLQDYVLETIEKFRDAGLQVWMLTGDKIETAKCIAIATGMNRKTEKVHELRGDRGQQMLDLKESIEQYDKTNKQKTMLMIDGQALAKITSSPEMTTRFFTVAAEAKSVCVCRCSPTQKAMVARCVKFYTGKRIACVGDGGNDVAMIQEADVGLGIVGKEGMQASLASDFSLTQFSHLKELILWHGRMSYQRSAKLSQFIIHRGMIISFIQAIFTMIFFSVTIPIYNGYLILGYSTIYTSLPVFSLVLDEDVDRETCLKYPILYQTLQAGRSLNFKTFLIWVWKSIYQACIIMFLAVILFNDSFVLIVSITFTTLIVIEFLNVIQEVTVIRRKMIVSIIGSLIVYMGSIHFSGDVFQITTFDGEFLVKVGIITLASWVPVWTVRKLADWYDPNAVQKVRKSER